MTPLTLFPLEAPHPGTPSPAARAPAGLPPRSGTTDRRTAPERRDGPARRAADAAPLDVRSALTRQAGPSAAWFDWSANPYRGCEFACGYCSARGTHAWLGHEDPRDFQERLYVKERFAEALRRDLRSRVRPGEHVAFGTATDPYQPLERREGLMAASLREVARASGLRVSITTKSPLVTRDTDLLLRVAERNSVQVNFTVTTVDARLARFLEPRAPAPAARLAALRRLRQAGLCAGVFLMPVLPGITDGDADLRALVRAAAESGALFLAHQVVFLEGPSRAHFLGGLRRAYPRIAARYEVWTRTGRSLPLEVRQDVAGRLRALLRSHGIPGSGGDAPPPPPAHETQRTFAFADASERVA